MRLEWPPKNNDGIARRRRDLTAASLGLAILWPLILLLAALIKLDSPGTPIFKQTRIGYRGRPFTLYKFRTMVVGAEGLSESPNPSVSMAIVLYFFAKSFGKFVLLPEPLGAITLTTRLSSNNFKIFPTSLARSSNFS